MVLHGNKLEARDEILVRELYPRLRRFAAVVGPVEVDPDDLVQEALLRVLERTSLDELDHPGAYVRRTVFNLASNHRRGLARHRVALGRIATTEEHVQSYPSDLQDLQRLTPMMRAALYLTAVEGRSFSEVAMQLGCSEAAASKAAARGRRKLRHLLSGEERANATA